MRGERSQCLLTFHPTNKTLITKVCTWIACILHNALCGMARSVQLFGQRAADHTQSLQDLLVMFPTVSSTFHNCPAGAPVLGTAP